MPQKKWKFNIIDVIVIILAAAVVLFVAYKLVNRSAKREIATLTYQVIVEEQPVEMYEAAKKHIPSRIMASGALYDAEIIAVEATPTLVCSNGEWVEDPSHVTLLFTVTAQVEKTPVILSSVGSQEIRVGNEIILKTEYIEFDPAYVTSVEYAS